MENPKKFPLLDVQFETVVVSTVLLGENYIFVSDSAIIYDWGFSPGGILSNAVLRILVSYHISDNSNIPFKIM